MSEIETSDGWKVGGGLNFFFEKKKQIELEKFC